MRKEEAQRIVYGAVGYPMVIIEEQTDLVLDFGELMISVVTIVSDGTRNVSE